MSSLDLSGNSLDATGQPVSAQERARLFGLMLGFAGMVLGQFMAFLDIQIINSSLAQIQSGVSASSDEISWVQSAYLISEVVMIPLSSYLARWWGTQRLFMISCAGFTIMSVLTGLCTTIDAMIVTRALQGFIGGAMIPTVFSVAFSAFPPRYRMTTSMIISTVVSLAPTIGPTLGGFLTDQLSWRWLFFINVPPGLLVLFLVGRYGALDQPNPDLARNFDWIGLACMAAFLMAGQYVLEEGTREAWFHSDLILFLTVLSVLGGILFVWRSLTRPNPIVELQAFADSNFRIGCFLSLIAGMGLFGSTYLLPLFLARIRGDSASQIGLTMAVSGAVMFIMGPIATRMSLYVVPRTQVIIGFLIAAAGMWISRDVTKDWSFTEFLTLQVTRSVGMALALFTAQNITMGTLKSDLMMSAGSLVNLSRNVGGAFGLAVLTTILAVSQAQHLSDLSARFSIDRPAGSAMMEGLAERMGEMGLANPELAAHKMMSAMLHRDALVLAFSDCYLVLTVAFLAAAAAALMAKPTRLDFG